MTRDELRKAGETIYGRQWQRQLSEDLGIAERTMRRWLAGTFSIPDDLAGRIKAIARQRIAQIKALG